MIKSPFLGFLLEADENYSCQKITPQRIAEFPPGCPSSIGQALHSKDPTMPEKGGVRRLNCAAPCSEKTMGGLPPWLCAHVRMACALAEARKPFVQPTGCPEMRKMMWATSARGIILYLWLGKTGGSLLCSGEHDCMSVTLSLGCSSSKGPLFSVMDEQELRFKLKVQLVCVYAFFGACRISVLVGH